MGGLANRLNEHREGIEYSTSNPQRECVLRHPLIAPHSADRLLNRAPRPRGFGLERSALCMTDCFRLP